MADTRTVEEWYAKLQGHLSQQRWQDADDTTRELLCSLAGCELPLVPEAVPLIGCQDVHKICSLWDQHSTGRYGLAIQARIWSEVGGMARVWTFETMSREEKEALGRIENRFAKRTGMPRSRHSDPTQPGRFPYSTLMCSYGFGLVGMLVAAFARRLVDCGLVAPDVTFSDQP